MKTERRFANELKTMMSEMPLEDITVSLLCKKCHVQRQTFYYHFHDIYDLIMVVFLNEKIVGVQEAKNITQLISRLYEYYTKNKNFIDASLQSAGKDLFEEFVFNNTYQGLLKIMNQTSPSSKKITALERKSIIRFYSYSITNCYIYYLSNHKNKNLKDLLNNFSFIGDDFLEKSCLAILENRK
ncbi:MAG: TetR/AcrR family transcriptional regulator C-terminal domain-containing protein [Bacilli bacterium]